VEYSSTFYLHSHAFLPSGSIRFSLVLSESCVVRLSSMKFHEIQLASYCQGKLLSGPTPTLSECTASPRPAVVQLQLTGRLFLCPQKDELKGQSR